MEDNREELVRQRAYAIWEEQGKPQGEDMRHWLQAWQELADTGDAASSFGETDPDESSADVAGAVTPADQEGSAAAHAAPKTAGNGATPVKSGRKKKV
jgi:uncharacterized protein (DUF305 family)